MTHSPLLKTAVILGAHGIRGEVKLLPLVDNFTALAPQALDRAGALLFSFKITGTAKGALIVKPDSSHDRNAAELLKGKELYARASALPALADGEFYHSELVGLAVRLENGAAYGTLVAMHNFGAGDIMEIERDGSLEMLPFKAPWLGEINKAQGYVIVTPPDYVDAGDA